MLTPENLPTSDRLAERMASVVRRRCFSRQDVWVLSVRTLSGFSLGCFKEMPSYLGI
jgi:hypothetical protein